MKEIQWIYVYHDITPWILICSHFKILRPELKSKKIYLKERLGLAALRSKTHEVSLVSVVDRIWFQN